MKDKKFKKEVLKEKKLQKRHGDETMNKTAEDGIIRDSDGKVSCCIPFMKCTRIGFPIPTSLNNGVKFECTNSECIFSQHLVHIECFESLELSLNTLIENQGLNNALSQKCQIKSLWSKQGLSLIHKNLKCACGKGIMKRDEESWMKREKMLEPPKEEKKKHKPKATHLPSLEYGCNKTGPARINHLKACYEFDLSPRNRQQPSRSIVYVDENKNASSSRGARKHSVNSVTSDCTTSTSKSSDATVSAAPDTKIQPLRFYQHTGSNIKFLFKSNETFGIQIYEDNQLKMLPNIFGNNFAPMYLSLANGKPEFGEKAKENYKKYPSFVIYDILNIVGKALYEIKVDPKWGFKVSEDDGVIFFEVDSPAGPKILSEQLLIASFLKFMKNRVEEYLNNGQEISQIDVKTDFKISIPQKHIFFEAGLKCGIEILSFDLIDTN
uniref:Uncharacterized protein n=1 Tax=Panagrolaimus sp. ES5 TaxID=591445 RepID=A0AC34FJS5_9BILA